MNCFVDLPMHLSTGRPHHGATGGHGNHSACFSSNLKLLPPQTRELKNLAEYYVIPVDQATIPIPCQCHSAGILLDTVATMEAQLIHSTEASGSWSMFHLLPRREELCPVSVTLHKNTLHVYRGVKNLLNYKVLHLNLQSFKLSEHFGENNFNLY